jgi:predicted esterase
MSRSGPARWLFVLTVLFTCSYPSAWLQASTVVLKDGRRLQGRLGKTAGLAENPQSNTAGTPATITLVDDDLRRVFIPTFQIQAVDEVNTGEIPERVHIHQRVANAGGRVNRVGQIVKVTPFDVYGRRVVTMRTDKGNVDAIQGITMITPRWTKVEGLLTSALTPLVWDMRIATSSVPRDTLHAILVNNTTKKNLEQRLRVVRLFLQAERYQDAQQELEGVLADFPDENQLKQEVQALRQLHARSIVKEIEVRRQSGQHFLAYNLLDKFPTEDVASETLQQVREMLGEYQKIRDQRDRVVAELEKIVADMPPGDQRTRAELLNKEMAAEMSMGNFDRLAAYLRLGDDKSLSPEQKLSLAYSGWLLGSDSAETNLLVTLSLAQIRDLILQYMNEPVLLKRNEIEQQLRVMEGAAVPLVAKLIAHMKPPHETPAPSVETPGLYKLQVPIGIDNEADVTYHVQLPPEYDPHRRYPTIVTLNGTGTTPENQVDWWAGAPAETGNRLGQATRFGYIVIAVEWLKEGQREYGFTAREHAAVLASLRDACRRFSIDTDRVFLTGHSVGGDAAWDIGLAHPDLWAGVIPIVAQTKKYCSLYWQNASLVPFYVVQGELDGEKLKENARDLDRYMTHRYDVTVVEYQGRGHEDFYEEIQNLFEWMGRRPGRDFFPKEFQVSTMRTWDNYFWWLEVAKLPEKAVVEPSDWPPARGTRPAELRGKVLANGDIVIPSTGIQAALWLSPEILNPGRDTIDVTIGGRRHSVSTEPSLNVLLDDVRTRGDRLHPFWAKWSQ